MNEQHRDGLTHLALRSHERVVDNIRDRYIQGPIPSTAKQDARIFFESKLRYSGIRPDDLFVDEIEDCRESLREADRDNWIPARRAILRVCGRFLESDDEGQDKIAIAFANLANSLPKPPIEQIAG